eukprot:366281-Chlamydomonas_euryale.AAC.24
MRHSDAPCLAATHLPRRHALPHPGARCLHVPHAIHITSTLSRARDPHHVHTVWRARSTPHPRSLVHATSTLSGAHDPHLTSSQSSARDPHYIQLARLPHTGLRRPGRLAPLYAGHDRSLRPEDGSGAGHAAGAKGVHLLCVERKGLGVHADTGIVPCAVRAMCIGYDGWVDAWQADVRGRPDAEGKRQVALLTCAPDWVEA